MEEKKNDNRLSILIWQKRTHVLTMEIVINVYRVTIDKEIGD